MGGWHTTTTPRALRLPERQSTTLALATGWGTTTTPRALRLRARLSIRIHFRLCPTCRRTTRLSWRAAVLLEVEGCLSRTGLPCPRPHRRRPRARENKVRQRRKKKPGRKKKKKKKKKK